MSNESREDLVKIAKDMLAGQQTCMDKYREYTQYLDWNSPDAIRESIRGFDLEIKFHNDFSGAMVYIKMYLNNVWNEFYHLSRAKLYDLLVDFLGVRMFTVKPYDSRTRTGHRINYVVTIQMGYYNVVEEDGSSWA